ncbi:MAG: hypothetical protein KF858_11035 [Candidatus Sumerlaeia bacterium]|nr:hypothetical protein [Candidatus Sumerlaeia bacterium]
MKTTTHFLLLALLTLVGIGCGSKGSYRPLEATAQYPTIPARVIVTDFRDERESVRTAAAISKVPPLTFSRRFEFSHPDNVYSGSIDPVPTLMAKSLARSLADGRQFEEVTYISRDELPPKGDHDLLITGRVRNSRMTGRAYFYSLVFPLGVQFSDVLWYIGFPKMTRRYNFDVSIEMLDYYRDTPIAAPIEASQVTSKKTFLHYAPENKLDDLKVKVTDVWNDVVEAMRRDVPTGQDAQYWASLRTTGQSYLASLALEAERMRLGTPPVFQFLSPSEGSMHRTPTVTVRWSAAIPNGLRAIDFEANGEALATGVRSTDMMEESTARRDIPARDVEVKLNMGSNRLFAQLVDFRGNVTKAELQLDRLPRLLNPQARHALLVGSGPAEAGATVEQLRTALTDPFAGQFSANAVKIFTPASLDRAALEEAVVNTALSARAGELLVLYIAARGDAATMTFGNGIPLREFATMLQRSVATTEVVLLFDIDWDRTVDGSRVLASLGDLPPRWAIGVSSGTPAPAARRDGRLAYGDAIAASMRRGTGRLTLRGMLDAAAREVGALGTVRADSTGSFDTAITMAEFE